MSYIVDDGMCLDYLRSRVEAVKEQHSNFKEEIKTVSKVTNFLVIVFIAVFLAIGLFSGYSLYLGVTDKMEISKFISNQTAVILLVVVFFDIVFLAVTRLAFILITSRMFNKYKEKHEDFSGAINFLETTHRNLKGVISEYGEFMY